MMIRNSDKKINVRYIILSFFSNIIFAKMTQTHSQIECKLCYFEDHWNINIIKGEICATLILVALQCVV